MTSAAMLFLMLLAAQTKPDVSFEEKLLATIPPDIDPGFEPTFSPDGRSVAYSTFVKGSFVIMIGAKRSDAGPFESGSDFLFQNPSFSPDRKTVVFVAKSGGKDFLVLDGKKSEAYERISDVILSPTGQNVAFVGENAGKSYLVIGDRKSEEFDRAGHAAWSPDGKTVAFVAAKGRKQWLIAGTERVEIKGEVDKPPVFSPDGKRIAVIENSRFPDRSWVTIGGEKGPAFEYVKGVVFSPDSKSFAYKVKNDGKWTVIVDGRKGEDFDEVEKVEPILFAPDGRTPVYSARLRRKWFVVNGDKKGPEFDTVGRVVFSRDGKILSYVAGEGDDEENTMTLFPIIAGKRGPKMNMPGERAFAGDVSFSPDATRIAYPLLKDKKIHVVVGEKRGDGYDRIGLPVFSPDGKKVAHGAVKGRELWWKVRPVE